MSLILVGYYIPDFVKVVGDLDKSEKVKINDLFERARIRVSSRNPDSLNPSKILTWSNSKSMSLILRDVETLGYRVSPRFSTPKQPVKTFDMNQSRNISVETRNYPAGTLARTRLYILSDNEKSLCKGSSYTPTPRSIIST